MVECEYCHKNDGIVNRKIIRIYIHDRCLDEVEDKLDEIFNPTLCSKIYKIIDRIIYLILIIAGLIASLGVIMYVMWGITEMFF